MAPEFLSVTPQLVRCYSCGAFTESPDGWMYRLRHGGHSAVCPSCRAKVEMELTDMTSNPNFGGAVLFGALAAAGGSLAWYAFTFLTDREYYLVALGIGWLVGKAVVLGSGDKRGDGLQVLAGVLAFIGVMGGRYLVVNHFVSITAPDHAPAWLTLQQFMRVNSQLLRHGDGYAELAFSVVAVCYATVYPRADRLVAEAPTGVRGWRRWVR